MIAGVKLAPSILSADLGRLEEQVREAEEAGADYIHIDVMDGHFVPVISFGTPLVAAMRRITNLTLDIHLMVEEPERHIASYIDAGGNIINVHVEATRHLHRIIQEVKGSGAKAGVCLNPATPASAIQEVLPYLDQVMVMSVNPGWAGQKFISRVLPKVECLKKMIVARGLATEIEIDGGITPEVAPRCIEAGACILVAASAIFNERATVRENIERLKNSIPRRDG